MDASLSIVGHFHIRNLTVGAWFAGSAATLLAYRGLWARPEIACVPTPVRVSRPERETRRPL
nr:MAG TPA: hypothetical protein [Caudoviricetes sp.]DAH86054.1 MAG TPA: hypothetical protein [Caudoviricetes sp.]